MTKKRNTGFSMVEILISVTIFAILMIPIVSGIVSSLKMSTNAKELQYRNEFAEHMMEHIKTVSVDEMQVEDYYVSNGTQPGSFSKTVDSTEESVDWDGDHIPDEDLKRSKYTLSGQTKIGTKSTLYNYRIEVDNSYYVEKKKNDKNFLDPNNLALGIVEDIDYTKVALIDGTILNYDAAADTSFKTKKLQALKDEDEGKYRQEIEGKGTTSNFAKDTASRLIRIEVSGGAASGYTVKCILDYMDSSTYAKGELISYTPYAQSFAELPNIYLMYNPCYYNSGYSPNDYIAVDTSGVTDSAANMPDVKVFLVEIAASYSSSIKDANSASALEGLRTGSLYRSDALSGVYRDDSVIHLTAVVSGASQLSKIKVYNNIGDNVDDLGNTKDNSKTDKSKFLYTDAQGAVDTSLRAIQDKINADLSAANKKTFIAMQYDNVGALNTATEETRGLYQVKIWLKEDSAGAINTATDQPILQGTKGGNET